VSTIAAALALARQSIPPSEARLLLCHLLGRDHAWLEAHRDAVLEPAQERDFAALVARRAAGEPVAYITGRREFFGRDFEITPAVLIPRPETELLVELGAAKIYGVSRAQVLDLGAGSGCVAITLALEVAAAQVTAVDVSANALALARRNAEGLHADVRFLQSDWFSALGDERFHLIVGNPPYVAVGDPHLSAGDLRFEPAGALASGVDGLDAIRRIVTQAPDHLEPGGWLILEHGYDQGPAVTGLLAAAEFEDIEQHSDLAGILRVSGGRHNKSRPHQVC
jgi:release factor glutamine methyltransferase